MNDLVFAIVGLGYVGLPLAVEFGKKYQTIGYDLSDAKIESCKNYHDPMDENARGVGGCRHKMELSFVPIRFGRWSLATSAISNSGHTVWRMSQQF